MSTLKNIKLLEVMKIKISKEQSSTKENAPEGSYGINTLLKKLMVKK